MIKKQKGNKEAAMSELTEDELKNNYREVKERIAEAAKRAGRDPKEVTLLAVSKTKPVSNIRTLMAEGQRAFGENYVQELTEKISEIGDAAEWHMIGHLQRNKVKYIIGKVRLIHAVDSVRLAEQIEKEAVKTGSEADVLMEVNIAREESKWGFMEEEALDAAHEIAAFPHVHLHGLMTSLRSRRTRKTTESISADSASSPAGSAKKVLTMFRWTRFPWA